MLMLLTFMLVIPGSLTAKPKSVLLQEVLNYHNDSDFKSTYAFQVVDKIDYSFSKQWFFTVSFCEFTYFENRILKYIEKFGYPVLLINSCPVSYYARVKPRIDKHGLTTYIVTFPELSTEVSEDVIETLMMTGVFKPRSSVVFVLITPTVINSYVLFAIRSHFQLLWSRSVTNSVLFVWQNGLHAYTYNPFYDEVLDVTAVQNISTLLARQYDNLYGHDLRLSVFHPLKYNTPGPILCDSRLAKTVIERLNASCIPLAPRDGNTVGDLLENGTATGQTADLMTGYADLELNSRILKNSFYGYIDTTYPLTQDELCFVVKKSGRQSTFMTIYQLISNQLLLLISCNVVVLLTMALIVRKIERHLYYSEDRQSHMWVIMEMIKCLIRQTVDVKFLGQTFRVVVTIIMLYSLVMDCVIEGVITSAITYPRYTKDMNTMTEIIQSNLTLGIHSREIRTFNKSLSPEDYEKLKNRMVSVNDHQLKDFFDKRQYQYAMMFRQTDAQYITQLPENTKSGRSLFHTMKQCPIPCFIVYGLRYGSPYLPKINSILHRLNQAGILQYWVKVEDTSKIKSIVPTDRSSKPLNAANLKEIFIVWALGIFVSTVAFTVEIFNKSCFNRRFMN